MRREKLVTITSEGRDKGKLFKITEFSSDAGERWAYRALLALSRGGIDVPAGIFDAGMAGLAGLVPYLIVIGFKSLQAARWEELEPLLDEMMTCVQYQPPQRELPAQDLLNGPNSQIEEIRTRAELRKEALMIHVNPFDLAAFQNSVRGDLPESQTSSDTPTSPP